MSEISGLNIFGNLTAKNGVKLTFNDIDLNKDGKISEEELDSLLKANDIDTIELSNIDNNSDKMISEDEFALYEYKMQIQEQLNNFQGKIAMDFSGELSNLIPNVVSQLRDFTNIFVNNNINDPKKMVQDYKVELPLNYEKIKASVLAAQTNEEAVNSASTVEDIPANTAEKGNTVTPPAGGDTNTDAIVSNLLDELVSAYMDELADTVVGITPEEIEAKGQALGQKLEGIISNFVEKYTGNNLEADLRAYVEEVLNQTEAERMADDYQKYQDVYNSLGSYIDRSDMVKLKAAAKELLSTALAEGVKVTLNGQEITNLDELDKALNEVTNANQLNADIKTLMDSLSDLDLKGLMKNDTIIPVATSNDIAIEVDDLNLDFLKYDNGYNSHWLDSTQNQAKWTVDYRLKEQLYNQINSDLKAKGLSMQSFREMFELCYKQSLDTAIDTNVVKNDSWWTRYSYDTKELVANFLSVFNEKLATAVDAMYQSDKDMDVVDIDTDAVLGKRNYSLSYREINSIEEFNNAMQNGETITVKHNGVNKLIKQADSVLEQFRDTLKHKAVKLCITNGLGFDAKQFDEIFNSTKDAAIDSSITTESKYPNLNGILGKYFTSATLNPKELVDNFLNNFKTNYENVILG